MLHPEMVRFFEGILENRTNEYRFAPEDLASEEQAEAKKAKIRRKLLELLKIDSIEEAAGFRRFDGEDRVVSAPAPHVELLSIETCEGYRRERWKMETLPGIYMPFFLLVPDRWNTDAEGTCFLAAHGHGPGKDSVAARRPFTHMYGYGDPKPGYGEILVKEGHLVLAPDMWGFGERRVSDTKPYGSNDCTTLSDAAEACGFTLLGLFVWDHMRAVDYLVSRPDCKNVAMIGFSGGGEQTIFTTALDGRIRAAYAGGYLHRYQGGMLYNHMCSCNFVPGLYRVMELSDVAGIAAPRPFLFENGVHDGLNGNGGIVNVEKAADEVRNIYRAYGAEECIWTNFWEGGHAYNGGKTLDFFAQYT